MQAIASSTSEIMAMMCEGSNLSNGNRNPVALVRIVVTRNNAVQLGITLEPRSPDKTTRPETTPIRLMMTCSIVKVDRLIPRTMTRSPLFGTGECYDCQYEKATGGSRTSVNSGAAPTRVEAAGIFEKSAKQTPPTAAILTIEKLDQFRDDLLGRFFHQPVPCALDKHALNVSRHHLALLDQERAAGFFS